MGTVKILGEEHPRTLFEANNLAGTLADSKRFKEAKALLRETMPAFQRVLGDSRDLFEARGSYAWVLYRDDCATVDDIREAVTILEDMERTARRNYGTAHPMTRTTGEQLQYAQETLRARETPATE